MQNDDIMILDAFNTIYIWIGATASKVEKQNCSKTVDEYISLLKDGRKVEDI